MMHRENKDSFGDLSSIAFPVMPTVAERARVCLANSLFCETDRVIVGGGWAAKIAYATLPNNKENVLILAQTTDPWSRRSGFLGQTSECLPVQFASRLPDTTYWIECSKFHKYIQGLSLASEQMTVHASVHSIKLPQDAVAKEFNSGFELSVEYEGLATSIWADKVDICTGPGPMRKLSTSNDDRQLLESKERIVYGDSFYNFQDMKGEEVLVYGGGSTAAWAVEHAIRAGVSRVDWFARPVGQEALSSLHSLDISSLRLKTARYFTSTNMDLRESILQDYRSILPGFAMAVTPRYVDPTISSAFSSPIVNFYHADLDLASFQCLADSHVRVTTQQRYSSDFDRAFVCIGNDDNAVGAVARLVDAQVQLRPIWRDRRALGVESEDGRLRVLGSAAAQSGLIQRLNERDRQRYLDDLRCRVATSGGPTVSSVVAVPVWYNAIVQANADTAGLF